MAESLTPGAVAQALRTLPGWQLHAGGTAIRRRWITETFAEAFDLVGRIAAIAEAVDHHPDLRFGWGYAIATLTTHDAGGLTERDIALAARIDQDIRDSTEEPR